MPLSPNRKKQLESVEDESQHKPAEPKKTTSFYDRASRLMDGKRRVWKCPGCGLRHYYDPVDRCRLPCGFKGQFYPEVE